MNRGSGRYLGKYRASGGYGKLFRAVHRQESGAKFCNSFYFLQSTCHLPARRGGNGLRSAGARCIFQGHQPRLLVPATNPPDGGHTAPKLLSHHAGVLSPASSQQDAGPLEATPTMPWRVRLLVQNLPVFRRDFQCFWPRTSHEFTPPCSSPKNALTRCSTNSEFVRQGTGTVFR